MSQDVSERESRRSDLLPGTAHQRRRALDAAWLRWHRQGNLVHRELCVCRDLGANQGLSKRSRMTGRIFNEVERRS
jgi:hypothetical protein